MTLSTRETQVLRLMCEGLASKEIGPRLGISGRTVEVHRMNAFRKMGARNAAQAAVMFVKGNAHDHHNTRGRRRAGC